MNVSVNAPRTPVTAGSNGFAAATLPNVCKMPGPPAPFVPTPLPNIGRSGDSPAGYSKRVTIEGKQVAIRGASFKSTGDIASKATGGGLVSSNTHGLTRFIGPGTTNVKIEGKSVHLLGEPMLNNCGPSGSPANSATMLGLIQESGLVAAVRRRQCPLCEKNHGRLAETKQTKANAQTLAEKFKAELDKSRAIARAAVRISESKLEGAKWMMDTAKVAKKATGAYTTDRENANIAYNNAKETFTKAGTAVKKRKNALKTVEEVTTMLGVVVCKCDKKYANQSGRKFIELCEAAHKATMKHPPDVTLAYRTTPEIGDKPAAPPMKALKDYMTALGKKAEWDQAVQAAIDYNASKALPEALPAAFPPGLCAAQGALLHLFVDRALPAAMTEQWFSYQKTPTSGEIRYFDSVQKCNIDRTFGHGESVPPCTTCVIILPYLLCTHGKTQCAHKT
jgi:uncharacterized Zn-binding protein involved in type VI secretion